MLHLPRPSVALTAGLGLAVGAAGASRLLGRLPRPESTSDDEWRRIGWFEVGAGGLLVVGATRPLLGTALTAAGTALLARDLADHEGGEPPVVLGALTGLAACATALNLARARSARTDDGPGGRG